MEENKMISILMYRQGTLFITPSIKMVLTNNEKLLFNHLYDY